MNGYNTFVTLVNKIGLINPQMIYLTIAYIYDLTFFLSGESGYN